MENNYEKWWNSSDTRYGKVDIDEFPDFFKPNYSYVMPFRVKSTPDLQIFLSGDAPNITWLSPRRKTKEPCCAKKTYIGMTMPSGSGKRALSAFDNLIFERKQE